MKKTFYISLLMIFLLGLELKAQNLATQQNQGGGNQIKNNQTEGSTFASANTNKAIADKGFEGSSLAKAIREGKFGNMPISTSPPATTNNPATNSGKSLGLASEVSSAEAKAAHDKAVKETQVVVIPPNLTQGAKKE